ncbi:MAG: hypothetical protein ACLQB1_30425 [Streptosporangiaceae bacterium]
MGGAILLCHSTLAYGPDAHTPVDAARDLAQTGKITAGIDSPDGNDLDWAPEQDVILE